MKTLQQKLLQVSFVLALVTLIISPDFVKADNGKETNESVNIVQVAQKPIEMRKPIGSIKLTEKSYFELEKASILPIQGEDTHVFFTISLHNGEDHELFMSDYWISLQAGTNSQIQAQLVPSDKGKNLVSSGTNKQFTFYATLKGGFNLEDLSFKFIQWDFGFPDYERPLGVIVVPHNYSDQSSVNAEVQTFDISNIPVSVSVYQAQISRNDKKILTLITLELENKGKSPIDIPDYQFYLQTSEGNNYRMVATEAGTVTIDPLLKKKLVLYAELPVTIKSFNWKLLISQLDTTSKLIFPIAQYDIKPANIEEQVVSVNESQMIEILDTPFKTNIANVLFRLDEDKELMNFYFQLKNEGDRSVEIPILSFSIQTGNGLIYPVVNASSNSLSIDPHEREDISLSASLPLSVGLDGLELILNQPFTIGKEKVFPMAVYAMPIAVNTAITSVEHNFLIQKKKFSAVLNSMNRYPWEDEDVLVADLTVSNKENFTMEIPAISTYFLLDGKAKIEAKVFVDDSVNTIKGDSNYHLKLIGKIPYMSDFTSIDLVLFNKENNKAETQLTQFTNNAEFLEMPTLAVGETYKLINKGRNSSIKVHAVQTYEGITKNISYVELEVGNEEKRLTNPLGLVAYFKTPNDYYYQLMISKVSQRISPSGKVLISGWASLPKSAQLKDFELVLGQGIEGNKYATEDGNPDALVNVVKFKLPAENKDIQSNLTKVDLYPYNVSFSKMNTTSTGILLDSIDIKFDYKLINNASDAYENLISGHKLLFEFVNGGSDTKFTSEFSLESGGGNLLQIGDHSMILTFTEPGLLLKLKTFDKYTINVYDQYQGNRKLLASKRFSWFQPSE